MLGTYDVDEAVLLSDRVVVMEARPGRIGEIIDVDLPRPRDRSHAAVARLRDEIVSRYFSEAVA